MNMKKLFGRDKPKLPKVTPGSRDGQQTLGVSEEVQTPIHQQYAVYQQPPSIPQMRESGHTKLHRSSADDERWEVITPYEDPIIHKPHPRALTPSREPSFASLPPGASPPISSPLPRSSSPYSIVTNHSKSGKDPREREKEQQAHSKKRSPPASGTAALGILKALDPHAAELATVNRPREDHGHDASTTEAKKEKKGFWERAAGRDKDKERERDTHRDKERERPRDRDRKEEEGQAELTRMIGFLTATASEDWALVLEVCDRASASEANAKEAVRALRREFKYGEPSAQLSAARLWAIMLRNASDTFINQSMNRKFLDTVEDLITSQRTSPVVRDRVMDVLAAAAFASSQRRDGRSDREGFRGLWKKVKPVDKPDEGMPIDTDDSMFYPPINNRHSQFEPPPISHGAHEPSISPPPVQQQTRSRRKSLTRNRIIPLEEDIRRLLQECKIGQGNASLLSQALVYAKPEDLQKEIIREFYLKCQSSQELIYAQIPWASAGAERSRREQDQFLNTLSYGDSDPGVLTTDGSPLEQTHEEKLLAALLAANAELVEALKQYDDMERVGVERQAEDRSRKETRMDRSQLQHLDADGYLHVEASNTGGSSRSRSPSPSPSLTPPQSFITPQSYPYPQHPLPTPPSNDGLHLTHSLAPPPAAPQGPRSPAHTSLHSRTPSPSTPSRDSLSQSNAYDDPSAVQKSYSFGHHSHSDTSTDPDDDEKVKTPIKPSEKALGKRRAADSPQEIDKPFDADDMFYFDNKVDAFSQDERPDSDQEDRPNGFWHQPVQYVYDAAAERTQQRIREGQDLVNGVH